MSQNKYLEKIIVSKCENVRTIDLKPLDNCPTLRVIKIVDNGEFKELILPSGCVNLEEIVISGNKRKPPIQKQNIEKRNPELEKVIVDAGFRAIMIEGKVVVQREEPVSFSERKAKQAIWDKIHSIQPIDLSVLDDSPNLRIIDLEDNDHREVVLPSRCPNLEVVLLDDSRVVEWRLEGCPRLRLVTYFQDGQNDGKQLDLSFLRQYKSPMKSPLIGIRISMLIPDSISGIIEDYEKFPEGIQTRIVELGKQSIPEYYVLLRELGLDWSSRRASSRRSKAHGGIFDPYYG